MSAVRGTAGAVEALGLCSNQKAPPMNSIVYLVGLVVIVMFVLSFIGLR